MYDLKACKCFTTPPFQCYKALVERGTYFSITAIRFMKAIYDAGVKEISRNGIDETNGFIWPSYVEDIMGPQTFDYGYGPFRWVCLSGKPEDLIKPTMPPWSVSPKNDADRTWTIGYGYVMPKRTIW